MGAAIAQVFATAGLAVKIYDPVPEVLETVSSRVSSNLKTLNIPNEPVVAAISTVSSIADAASDADLVIEAGPENLAVKQEIFAELDRAAPASAVLASNTSAIPVKDIARVVSRPERVIGTHFWNPPYLVPLVEVVRSAASSPDAIDWTYDLLDRVGMKPVRVATDVPGFVGNRLQHAVKREAIALVADGICTAADVDIVTRYGFGLRLGTIGPLEQSDLIGLDLTLAIHETLMPALSRIAEPHPLLVEKVRDGEIGAKAGQGFYEWGPGEAEARREQVNRELAELAQRRQARDRQSREVGKS
jgi:3-hydroxybutyryl-CoA dehydrogenase